MDNTARRKASLVTRYPAPYIQRRRWWWRWQRPVTVGSIAVALIAGAWLVARPPRSHAGNHLPARYHNEVRPGEDQAKLTLDDGSVIILIDTVNGVLATEAGGHTQVYKENTWLSYIGREPGDSLYFNTLCVPRKGRYKVILPDGSRVWLNAGSSLRYPVVFGHQRRVELRGEAYFEVTSAPAISFAQGQPGKKDSAGPAPFIVQLFTPAGLAELRVQGTRFNVKAYREETSIQATLLEGAITLTRGPNTLALLPGQQGRLENNGQIAVLNQANPEEAIAWKEAMFRFTEMPLGQFMKEVERWYGVEVIYKNAVRGLFTGSIERKVPLSQLLQYLETIGPVRFTIDGNKVIVN